MARLLFVLAVLAGTLSANAQMREWKVPDYDSVKAAVTNKRSVYYYPNLFHRYKANDTTLQRDEYHYLYYGYAYVKEEYKRDCLKDNKISEQIKEIMDKDSYTEDDYRKVVTLARKYLETNPFDFRKIELLYATYGRLEDTFMANRYLYKLRGLVRTILYSGDGRTDETGYHVAAVSDEYFILGVLGYRFQGQRLTPHPCDYMVVAPNEDSVAGVYFDITQIFQGYRKIFIPVIEGSLANDKADKKRKRKS